MCRARGQDQRSTESYKDIIAVVGPKNRNSGFCFEAPKMTVLPVNRHLVTSRYNNLRVWQKPTLRNSDVHKLAIFAFK